MKLIEALNLVAQATEPANAGKITRAGYVQLESALTALATALKPQLEAEQAAQPAPAADDKVVEMPKS